MIANLWEIAAVAWCGGYSHRAAMPRPIPRVPLRKRAPMAGVDPRAYKMREDRGPDSLEAHLRRLLHDLGLKGYHTRNSVGSAAGWPDWVIWGPHGTLFRELKSELGELTPAQRATGSGLSRAGNDWAVWRPRDLFSGIIALQLRRIA